MLLSSLFILEFGSGRQKGILLSGAFLSFRVDDVYVISQGLSCVSQRHRILADSCQVISLLAGERLSQRRDHGPPSGGVNLP